MGLSRDAARRSRNDFRLPRRWQLLERLRLRRLADQQLLSGRSPDAFPLLAWRATQLTSDRNRRVLVGSLRAILRQLDRRLLPGASPLNRPATRPHADLIAQLADRLDEVARPVSARGVLLIQALVTDGTGPFYARDRAGELPAALTHCLAELDVAPVGHGSRSRAYPLRERARVLSASNGLVR